jgi:uncharacterized protein (TIGR02145 family)
MKTTLKTGLAALVMLLTFSCQKESSTVQSSSITGKSSIADDMTEIHAPSVKIGTQVWMKRNLDVSYYRNGDRIPQVRERVKWAALTTGAWCWYHNDSAYGKLYNWYAVNDPRGLAPAGWHIPSDAEWTTLTSFLGGDVVAGGKMKSTGTIGAGTGLWHAPNTGATNSSGFTGLPGGLRESYDGTFSGISYYCFWWSSTEGSTNVLYYDGGYVVLGQTDKANGFSVRCLKN